MYMLDYSRKKVKEESKNFEFGSNDDNGKG